MQKRLIPFVALALCATALTSCGQSGYEVGVDLNYVLLIGQTDHNDSAARTRGIRDALGTRVDKAEQKTNPNTEKAKQGKLVIDGKTYRINELESLEQKNTAGATWDQQTATSSTQIWLNKHANDSWKGTDGKETKKQGINFFVSNNDGMAEGAIGADNWVSGMPIFGYDSNASTLQFIKDGKIMGTVNQNAPMQAGSIYMVARNILDGVKGDAVTTKGFGTANTGDWGYLASEYEYDKTSKALLAKNVAVTKTNVDDFTAPIAEQADKNVKTFATGDEKNIWQSYYSNTDTFLTSSMEPLFGAYAKTFKFKVTTVKGDGADESSVLNTFPATDSHDAYVINMVKTTSAELYLNKIAQWGYSKDKKFDKPVIFWNRQATLEDNSVDTKVMNDERFSNIYYVGFNANQGGDVQGKMIVDYLTANIASLTK